MSSDDSVVVGGSRHCIYRDHSGETNTDAHLVDRTQSNGEMVTGLSRWPDDRYVMERFGCLACVLCWRLAFLASIDGRPDPAIIRFELRSRLWGGFFVLVDVRFCAHNGLKSDIAPCPRCANKRLMHRNNYKLYSITSSAWAISDRPTINVLGPQPIRCRAQSLLPSRSRR
jgi:hypothetical protein